METLKCLFFSVVKFCLKNLFYLFPIQTGKVVFDNFFGKGYGDNPKYIADEMIRQKLNCKLVWLVKGSVVVPENIKSVPIKSIRSCYELATAQIIVANSKGGIICFFKKKKEQLFLQTWHGDFPLKYIEKEAEAVLPFDYIKTSKADSKITDAIISGNVFFSKILRESFWLPNNCDILEYGVPRNDIYFKDEDFRNQLKQKFGFSAEDRILLYAPTFRDDLDTDYYNINFEKLRPLLSSIENANWKIIIRLHPRIVNKSSSFTYNAEIINGSSFPDSQELCMVSDCLITDYSSIMSDFMLTSKPVFLYTPDFEEYSNQSTGRGLRDIFYELPFTVCRCQEELENTIGLFDKNLYLTKLNAFMKDYYETFDNGHASENTVNYIKTKLRI